MVSLQRATGPTALLDIAFLNGSMLKAFGLMRIRRLLRRGKGSEARERAESWVAKTSKAKLRAAHGRAMSPAQLSLAAGELLYQIGGREEALELCILPCVDQMMRDKQYVDAAMVLRDVLDVEPECARAQSLHRHLPADFA